MFPLTVNARTELRLVGRQHTGALFGLVDSNRNHLRGWHPWVDQVRSVEDIGKMISMWEQQHEKNRGFCAGIIFDGQLCGVIHHVTLDWPNRWTALSYWLAAAHQGQGIMTASCRAMIQHSFNVFKLNRVTIECATENTRSRAIPERLGFKLEGIIRSIEWLHDRYADHALYGLLRPECPFATEATE